jgi:hypothetical protein
MPYDAPGRADALSPELAERWNATILETFEGLSGLESRFFSIDDGALADRAEVDAVHWPGDPLEPLSCFDEDVVRALTDWGHRGRHELQNEYCEYAVVLRPDAAGALRPKRVQLTTELREYWMLLAVHDPGLLQRVASDVLGRDVGFGELYGDDPAGMDEDARRVAFGLEVAGHGNDDALVSRGVPPQPRGALNRENALFMTHPINGLDDLIFIVLFGARHFMVRTAGGFEVATRDDIFRGGREALACRHADPAAALGAYGAVQQAKVVAFANPLGMYIRPFDGAQLSFQGQPLPHGWIRRTRGDQRLEIGPGDGDDAFLDDIVVSAGQRDEPLTGGHQLVKLVEIGPLIATGSTTPATEDEFEVLEGGPPIECAATGVCDTVRALKREFDAAAAGKPGPRLPPGA